MSEIGKIEPAKVPAGEASPGTPGNAPNPGNGAKLPTGPGGKPIDLASLLGMPKPGLFDAMNAPLQDLTPDDIDFANEIDAALVRKPKMGARIMSITVFCMFIFLIIWAWVAEIDEVTHADGQVIASQRTQSIQNLEGGIVRAVNVREGDIVQKGDLLARLDNEVAEASFRDTVAKAIENALAIIRLEAEMKDEEPVFPKNMKSWLAEKKHKVDGQTLARAEQLLADQVEAYRSRKHLVKNEIDVLSAQLEQRERDVEEQLARRTQLKKSLDIAKSQRATAAELLKRDNFARMEYLNLEQKVVDLQGQIDSLDASIPRAESAVTEAKHRINTRGAEEKAQISQELNKRRVELNSLRENIAAGGDRVTRTEVRSPVRGTVKQIYANTVGGVVKPGEPIMDLVPLDDTLLIEARVKPQDVAFLRPDQNVMVKVSAYDFSIYGGLEGKLESISADTVEDKRGEFHYLVKIRTKKTAITHNNESLPIIPGMMVVADILTGKKTVLDYLMKPILKAKQNALRER